MTWAYMLKDQLLVHNRIIQTPTKYWLKNISDQIIDVV